MQQSSAPAPPALGHGELVPHEGVVVLVASLAGLGDRDRIRTRLGELEPHIEAQPPRSVRLLVDVTGATFDALAARSFRGAIRRTVPQLVAVALVGWQPHQGQIRSATTAARTRLEIPAFATVGAALDWLASEVPRPAPEPRATDARPRAPAA